MNTIQLIGNLCKDVELRVTSSGKKILDNTIAVRKDKKNAKGEYESDFIKIVLFDNNAEFLKNYASKGTKIGINGKLRVDNYQDRDGNYRTDTYVIVDRIELLTPKKVETEKQRQIHAPYEIDADNDLPF